MGGVTNHKNFNDLRHKKEKKKTNFYCINPINYNLTIIYNQVSEVHSELLEMPAISTVQTADHKLLSYVPHHGDRS